MGIHVGNNPFSLKPYHQLWSKGYFAAKLAFENGTAFTFGEWMYKKQKGLLSFPAPHQRYFKRPAPPPDRPILSFKRINKFNTNHRTVV